MEQELQLIVRRKLADDGYFADLVRLLSSRFGLDAYSVKQALRGFGLALLAKGPRTKLDGIADGCAAYGFDTWVIQPTKSPGHPNLVRGMTRQPHGLMCHTRSGEARIEHGDYVLVVMGDLSGSMPDKLLRRQALGGGSTGLDQGDQYATILRGKPLLDVFVIRPGEGGGNPKLSAMLRFAPGKFNSAGLGDLAGPTTVANLDAVVRLLRRISGGFLLDLNFGLSMFPRCRVESTAATRSGTLDRNAKSFERYGWMLLQVHLGGKKRSARKPGQTGYAGMDGALAASAAAATAASRDKAKKDQPNSAEALAGALVAGGALSSIAALDEGKPKSDAEVRAAEGDATLPPPPYVSSPGRFVRFFIDFKGLGVPAVMVVVFLGIFLLAGVNRTMANLIIDWGLQRGLLFFGFAAVCLGFSFRTMHVKRLLENTPTSKVRSAAMGIVELCGSARRAYGVISPVSQWPCVYYRTRRYKRSTDSHGHQGWQLVDELCSGPIPFFLQDETGKVLIDPKGARLKVRHRHETFGGGGLVRLLGAPTQLDMDEKLIEEMIPEMATVYVLGFAQPRRAQRLPLRRRVAMKLRDLKKDSVKLMDYDLDMDGKIDDHEWEIARRAMEKEALEDVLRETDDVGPPVVVGQPPHGQLPFVVAEEQEPELTQAYVWKSRLWLIASVVLLIIGVLSLSLDYG